MISKAGGDITEGPYCIALTLKVNFHYTDFSLRSGRSCNMSQSPFSIWPELSLPLFRTCLPDASLQREGCSCCQRQQSRSICVNNNERSDDCLYLLVQQCRQDEVGRGNSGWQRYQYCLCQQGGKKLFFFLQMHFMGQALHHLITVWVVFSFFLHG